MKKTNVIIVSTASLVALAAVAGLVTNSFAASSTPGSDPTVQNQNTNGMMGQGQGKRFATSAERDAWIAKMDAKRQAEQDALNANDYDAWVKAEGSESPMLQKINKDNFSKFVEAHKLMDQARSIMKDLGIEGPGFGHMGMRGGRHFMGMGDNSNPTNK